MPILAVFTAFVISGLVIWATTGDILKVIGPDGAFVGLWQGALGSPQNIAATLITSTPYIFAGLFPGAAAAATVGHWALDETSGNTVSTRRGSGTTAPRRT